MEFKDQIEIKLLQQPIKMPCGLELKNRLAKAAMAPCFAKKGQPTSQHHRLYHQWSQDSFGLIITENVQVCPRHLATPYDISIKREEQDEILKSWKEWLKSCKNTPTLIQLSHAGLQSPRGCGRFLGEKSLAPSSIRLSLGNRFIDKLIAWLLFDLAKQVNQDDIHNIIQQFKSSALFCYKVGFHGIQLHCSHGFLLSEFLSAKTNQRQDEYGINNGINRLRILFKIIDAINLSVPKTFCLAIKLNCSDFSEGGLTQQEALENLKLIIQHGRIDLIEISGGTYQNYPMSKQDISYKNNHQVIQSTNDVEAYYTNFTKEAYRLIAEQTQHNRPILMTTGGFRSRRVMAAAIFNQETDIVGIGRPACIDPLIATKILDSSLINFVCPSPSVPGVTMWKILIPVNLVGAGFKTMWHTWQLHRMSNYQKADLNCTALGSLRVILPLEKIILISVIIMSVLFLYLAL